MSKIGVALALCVLLLGAALLVGNSVGRQAMDRGGDIGSSLSKVGVGSGGTITIEMP